MSDSLGSLEQVPLRKIWPHEAADFTPWLAEEENLALLGQALGLELEVEEVERAVGPYSADIVARDATGALVVIENQLEKTNHDHLGKCLTYASVLDASTVIWIASSFTDEHKKALDWLNDKTGVGVGFYAVRLELWSIDDSSPAIRFNVVSYPAEIVKRGQQSRSERDLSETKTLQLEWWTAVRDGLVAQGVVRSPQEPGPRYWYNVALGRSGMALSCTANTWDNAISVRVYLRGRNGGDAALAELLESREAIETEIGDALEWNPNPDAADKTIRLLRKADLSRRDRWPEYVAWMVDGIKRFRETFGPRVKRLELSRGGE